MTFCEEIIFFGLYEEYKAGPTIGLVHCDLDFSKFNAKVNKDRSNMRLVVREFIFDPKSSIEISFSVLLGVLAIISVLLMMAESVDEELFQNFYRFIHNLRSYLNFDFELEHF